MILIVKQVVLSSKIVYFIKQNKLFYSPEATNRHPRNLLSGPKKGCFEGQLPAFRLSRLFRTSDKLFVFLHIFSHCHSSEVLNLSKNLNKNNSMAQSNWLGNLPVGVGLPIYHPQKNNLIPHTLFLIPHFSLLISHSSFLITHYPLLISHSSLLISHFIWIRYFRTAKLKKS